MWQHQPSGTVATYPKLMSIFNLSIYIYILPVGSDGTALSATGALAAAAVVTATAGRPETRPSRSCTLPHQQCSQMTSKPPNKQDKHQSPVMMMGYRCGMALSDPFSPTALAPHSLNTQPLTPSHPPSTSYSINLPLPLQSLNPPTLGVFLARHPR